MLIKRAFFRPKAQTILQDFLRRSFAELATTEEKRVVQTFYKRELPDTLIPFSSVEGRKIFPIAPNFCS